MAFSLNRAQIIGNVTRDPEVRVAGTQKVATFGVATNLVWTDQSGQRKERAEFHNVVAWRKLAEICEKYLKKGAKVYVEGRMQTRDWEGEDGVKRYKTEIVAENIILLGSKGEPVATNSNAEDSDVSMPAFSQNRAPRGIDKQKTATTDPAPTEETVVIDDLPF